MGPLRPCRIPKPLHSASTGSGKNREGGIRVDGACNIIFDTRNKGRRTPIAVVGLRDSILVQTDDATLLAHKSQSQKVKELVRRLAAFFNAPSSLSRHRALPCHSLPHINM
jgi:hypothetical protein